MSVKDVAVCDSLNNKGTFIDTKLYWMNNRFYVHEIKSDEERVLVDVTEDIKNVLFDMITDNIQDALKKLIEQNVSESITNGWK